MELLRRHDRGKKNENQQKMEEKKEIRRGGSRKIKIGAADNMRKGRSGNKVWEVKTASKDQEKRKIRWRGIFNNGKNCKKDWYERYEGKVKIKVKRKV